MILVLILARIYTHTLFSPELFPLSNPVICEATSAVQSIHKHCRREGLQKLASRPSCLHLELYSLTSISLYLVHATLTLYLSLNEKSIISNVQKWVDLINPDPWIHGRRCLLCWYIRS